MRGYFGIGIEGASKPLNVGTLFRSAHAFGASFAFTVDADFETESPHGTDTSKASEQMPYYHFPNLDNMMLPTGCTLVGVELTPDAIELPSFKHPARAAYVFGPERGDLSPETQEHCEFILKIPMKFCINVAIAANIVMYDRLITLGRFAPRPVRAGGPTEEKPVPFHGRQLFRTIRDKKKGNPDAFRRTPPPDYSVVDGTLGDDED